METTLNKLVPGDKGVVKKVSGTGAVRRRLFDMGLTPGAAFDVRKMAPLGDPMELTLRGYELSVRKEDAQLVTVERSQV